MNSSSNFFHFVIKFVPFTERVNAIKIDPIRQLKKKPIGGSGDEENTVSYFLTAFNHWAALNMSTSFTDFAAECAPLCQSLPLIIHNQHEINELLQKYINKKDENSLESLLEYAIFDGILNI